MQDIEELCERVILIDHGRLMFDGPLETIVERFAGNKIVEVKFSAPATGDASGSDVVLEQTPDLVRIETPRTKVADVCRSLLDRVPVADLTVTEPPIEEIIRQFFGGKE